GPRHAGVGPEVQPIRSVLEGSFEYRRSEEHTSELQSQFHLVCRLLLDKRADDKWFAQKTLVVELAQFSDRRHFGELLVAGNVRGLRNLFLIIGHQMKFPVLAVPPSSLA